MKTGDLIYTPSYYYIGHFSKFIRPDAKRVSTASSRSNLLSTTFKNVDGSIITVVMNSSSVKIKYNLIVDNEKAIVEIPAHAIQTLVY
jgi:glucosylceramidase